MADILISGISSDQNLRFFSVDATETVKDLLSVHDAPQSVANIFGKIVLASIMMGLDLKNERDILTVKLDSEGLLKTVIATSNNKGEVKGCFSYNGHYADDKEKPQLISKGLINVTKDIGLKTPYSGTVEIFNCDIAGTLTHYFFKSEQQPSAILLGLLFIEHEFKKAGGFIVQPMPNCPENLIRLLENNIQKMPNMTDLLDIGYDISTVLEKFILKSIPFSVNRRVEPIHKCNCCKERFLAGLKLLTIDDLKEMITEKIPTVIECNFCRKKYSFTTEDLQKILESISLTK